MAVNMKLEEVNAKLSALSDQIVSIRCLQDALMPGNGTFIQMFNKMHQAHSAVTDLSSPAHQWAMLYTYFVDFCESLSAASVEHLMDLISRKDLTTDKMKSLCDDVIQELVKKREKLEEEQSDIVYDMIAETVRKAA